MVVIQPPKSTPDAPWPVSVVSELVRDWIARLGSVWIEGELTGWSIRGGHAYGKIKDLDADATLSVTAWRSVVQRLDGEFKQGDRVIASVKPDFWVKGGTLSMQVSDLRHVGLGDLLERLERLRKQLAAEGLFADARKKPLPFLPGTIGLITGRESDAEKDVRRNSELRWPAVQFRTIHTSVQGERTVAEVSAALRELDADPEVDVIIVARGGGDFQHLLPFSDESLVRLVSELTTPVVSAIGHEADRPILDDVADLRASTPTDAAKRVVPDVAEELAGVQQARSRILQRIVDRVRSESNALESLVSRPALANPRGSSTSAGKSSCEPLSAARNSSPVASTGSKTNSSRWHDTSAASPPRARSSAATRSSSGLMATPGRSSRPGRMRQHRPSSASARPTAASPHRRSAANPSPP